MSTQEMTVIAITKNLRDTIKIAAAQNHITMQLYIERLVMKDLGLENIPR